MVGFMALKGYFTFLVDHMKQAYMRRSLVWFGSWPTGRGSSKVLSRLQCRHLLVLTHGTLSDALWSSEVCSSLCCYFSSKSSFEPRQVNLCLRAWQILTAHALPFRGARDLAFCLMVPLDSVLVLGEQRRFWRDCADAQARLNLRCSHRR